VPPDRAPRRPAVVLVHGGPWVRGVHWQWSGLAKFLAAQGWVVVEPEFRGSAGYGDRWFRAGFRQWEGAMQDDVEDAIASAVDQGLVDAERVCIAGASYGGYAALMGPIRYPQRYRCAAAWVGVTEPRLLFKSDGWNDTSGRSVRHTLPELIGDPKADAAAFDRMSVVARAAELKVPVLLAYGAQDRRVPREHGDLLREALKAQGRDPEWIVYAEEAHGWLKPANRLDFAERLRAFLSRHLDR
jgi:dipeptidyl aminopeptidase/acylaminoacyl peptidase